MKKYYWCCSICLITTGLINSRKIINKFKILTVLFFLVFLNITYSQNNWQRVYGSLSGYSKAYGEDICISNNGYYFLIGNNDYPEGMHLRKLNNIGQVLDTTFIHSYIGFTSVPTNDGGCIISGFKRPADDDIYAMKINQYLNIEWIKEYSETPAASCKRIIKTRDNGYLLCGDVAYWSSFVIKTDSLCNKIWMKVFSAPLSRDFSDIIEANDSGYLVTEHYSENYYTNYNYFTKLDTSGNIIWQKNYSSSSLNIWQNTIKSFANGYAISCDFLEYNPTTIYPGFIIVDNNGNLRKTNKFNYLNGYEKFIKDIGVINNNRFIFIFEKYKNDTTKSVVVISDSNGVKINENEFSSPAAYTAVKVIKVKDPDNIFMVGTSDHIFPEYENIYLLKTDTTLNVPVVGIKRIASEIPKEFTLEQNYPNPFNQLSIINFKCSIGGYVSIVVYDLLGRKVRTLVNEYKQPGTYQVSFDAEGLTSGIYFYKMTAGEFTNIKRMVLIK